MPATSVYQLDQPWTDQDKKARRLGDWTGGPVMVSLIFSRCQYSCPVIIKDLQDFEAKLTEAERGKMRVLLISLDPSHDTPEVLRAFAEQRGIDLTRWTLLNGGEAQVRMLSVALNDRYKATGKGEFSHGSGSTLLDAQGRIIYQGQDQAEALKALRGL